MKKYSLYFLYLSALLSICTSSSFSAAAPREELASLRAANSLDSYSSMKENNLDDTFSWREFPFYSRKYNEVMWLGCHNAYASKEDGYNPFCYDQTVGIEGQWNIYDARFSKVTIAWTPPVECCSSWPFQFYDGSYEDGQQIVVAHGNQPYGAYHVTKYGLKMGEPETLIHWLERLKGLLDDGYNNFKKDLASWTRDHPSVKFEEGVAIDDEGLVVPMPVPPIATIAFQSFLGKNGKSTMNEALKEAGLFDMIYRPKLKEYDAGRFYPAWPTIDEMLTTNKRLIITSDNPYDCALTLAELEQKEDAEMASEVYEARLKDPKNFPQDEELGALSTFFTREAIPTYTIPSVEREDASGYDGLGIAGYLVIHHGKGKPNIKDYSEINAYDSIKKCVVDCHENNGAFPNVIQMQLLDEGDKVATSTEPLIDEKRSVRLDPNSVTGKRIAQWINGHSPEYFAPEGVPAPATRPTGNYT